MDAFTDPRIEEIAFMTGAQVGKTQIFKNAIGYFIDQDPSPMLYGMPTDKMARSFSKDRLSTMFRDTPCLQKKVKTARTKNSSNEILHKTFPGGHFTMIGMNSPSDVVSRPVRIFFGDEVDKYKPSVGFSGDPIELAKTRTRNFWNRKIALASTPEIEGSSTIERAFKDSDQRYYYVPCPKCGEMQKLIFSQLKWTKTGEDRLPDEVWYECIKCKAKLTDADRLKMISRGEWRATYPERTKHAGFFIWSIYSPWMNMKDIATKWVKTKRSNNPEMLKAVTNEILGEPWRYEEEAPISEHELMARVEDYEKVPRGCFILTAGADVHPDRIECQVTGWGLGEESWLIDYQIFIGPTDRDPARSEVWKRLDQYLRKRFMHEEGLQLPIRVTFIDSGALSNYVYAFTKPRLGLHIFAVKGVGGEHAQMVGKPSRNNRLHVVTYPIGDHPLKVIVFSRLRLQEFGPGYMHFNRVKADDEYFSQLTAEKLVHYFSKGMKHAEFRKIRPRNEVLDCTKLSLAAFLWLNPNMEAIARAFGPRVEKAKQSQPQSPMVESQATVEAESKASYKAVHLPRKRKTWFPF